MTFHNFLSDQFSGLHGILIPGTQRDSSYILEGLLEQGTALTSSCVVTGGASRTVDLLLGSHLRTAR
ncbi:Tn3 family transposase [Streptomyces sp. NPDC059460]|uniref:Tn3 family transposase n=1 Tax=Streptomyces sp. NPDC059460 TaxID=3346840 RepID=UPI0036972AA4